MNTMTKGPSNQPTAQALAAVTPLTPLLVTERDRIEAVDAPVDPVARLRAEARVTPARAQPLDWPEWTSGLYTPGQVDALWADSRGAH